MQITVGELSKLLGGSVLGDANIVLNDVAKIEDGKEGALSFLSNLKYENHIYTTKSSAVLVNKSFEPTQKVTTTLIFVDDAYANFTFLLEKFSNVASRKEGIEKGSVISHNAKLGVGIYVGALSYIEDNVHIGDGTKIFPQVYVGENCTIGKNCTLYSGVKIYHNCVIGDNVILHSGVIVGSDGFGFAPLADRSYKKIPQTGNVIIEDDVEIGANTTVDRATMGSTILRKGVKLDNQIQIAHNVEIGEHTVIAGQSGIAGSTIIGKYCIIAGQVAISGHITIADGSVIGGKSGVSNSIKEPEKKWFGSPAFDYKEALKSAVVYRRLPELLKRIEELEKELQASKGQ